MTPENTEEDYQKQLSDRLRRVLDELEKVTTELGEASDEFLLKYLIEKGEIDPNKTKDFMIRPDSGPEEDE